MKNLIWLSELSEMKGKTISLVHEDYKQVYIVFEDDTALSFSITPDYDGGGTLEVESDPLGAFASMALHGYGENNINLALTLRAIDQQEHDDLITVMRAEIVKDKQRRKESEIDKLKARLKELEG